MKNLKIWLIIIITIMPVAAFADILFSYVPTRYGNAWGVNLFRIMSTALLLTIAIEALVLRFVLRVKGKFKDLLLINAFTNPLANIAFIEAGLFAYKHYYSSFYEVMVLMFIIEAVVVAVETKMLKIAGIGKPFRTSIILNTSSFFGGLAIGILMKLFPIDYYVSKNFFLFT